MEFKRLKCKFCNRKVVMWKLIGISHLSYFPLCYECANNVKLKLSTFDTTKQPVKKEILKRAKIKISEPKPIHLPYGK